MAPPDHAVWPLKTEVLGKKKESPATDALPATYHYYEAAGRQRGRQPGGGRTGFLTEGTVPRGPSRHDAKLMVCRRKASRHAAALSCRHGSGDHRHRPDGSAPPLGQQGEAIHQAPSRAFFFIQLFAAVAYKFPDACACHGPLANTCQRIPRRVALGFLYTYFCLISSESDFYVANENRLLPCREDGEPLEWADWKILARELLQMYEHEPDAVHPRFLRAELRLSRINIIHRFTSLPRFNPYIRGRHNYGSLFRDNLT
ncbi:hypothetical protein MFIFM68171_02199 [Madurella fahalii]|uniref:Uncharacterized protein n=1 Tax=Madurella fahalii TaxID=1157608 RepID=A0ABQ0G2L8_9PEZI